MLGKILLVWDMNFRSVLYYQNFCHQNTKVLKSAYIYSSYFVKDFKSA